ncbi:MAG TPA: peptidoglycan-associated lipoprotein Pal [Ferrovibrio sp.]|jgi:peptidoglycan-associated lipoprotein|uniref:peptidoglycan-associated lipoprotein Pal n=1 Tax=Ferrovibrio sp. TaxID=1917215 RepID=UPI002B4ACC55|nr:peptidoglycan-associated lipoprotein Pal [Ferrovibrio sp.]HLT77677.1 peptidoglycan-associated lipoprotein Pal [Ferrovibrio sp.]
MRLNTFGSKIVAVAAVGLFMAACSSDPAPTAATSGSGSTQQTATAPAATGIQAGTVQDFQVNVGDRVFFDYDKYEVKPAGKATLDKQAAWLKRYPQWKVVIEGHCDERGTREYNLALGERRANAVKNYLVNQGIPANRVTTISYGKERPVALGSNEAAWAQNRRGVTVLSN